MKEKIVFITQAKGGSGKSVLAFMLAEKGNV
jgi:cellulose biosynthesis protein BcsQ